MELVRSFIAIPLPSELQQRIGSLQRELKQRVPELRPASTHNLHLSLQFLGDQSQDVLDKVGQLLQSLGASTPSFTVTLKGVGSFPTGKRPRVVWLGVDPPEPLLALQAALAEGLCDLGLPLETRRYRPHLTLGRLRSCPDNLEFLEKFREYDCGSLEVISMILFSSRLTPNAAVHQPLCEVELRGSG